MEAVGATVSDTLFQNGMIALGLALVAMLLYIWFRSEWQFASAPSYSDSRCHEDSGSFAITGCSSTDQPCRHPHHHGYPDQRQGRGL